MSAAEHKGRVDHLHTGRLGVGFLTHMCDRKSSEDTCFIPRGETRFSSNSWNFCSEIEGDEYGEFREINCPEEQVWTQLLLAQGLHGCVSSHLGVCYIRR